MDGIGSTSVSPVPKEAQRLFSMCKSCALSWHILHSMVAAKHARDEQKHFSTANPELDELYKDEGMSWI